MSVCLSICLSIQPSTHPPTQPSIHPFSTLALSTLGSQASAAAYLGCPGLAGGEGGDPAPPWAGAPLTRCVLTAVIAPLRRGQSRPFPAITGLGKECETQPLSAAVAYKTTACRRLEVTFTDWDGGVRKFTREVASSKTQKSW